MRSLLCDAAHAPLTLVPVEDAVSRVATGSAYSIADDPDRVFRSERLTIPAPRIIAVPRIIPLRPLERANVTRRVLFARDQYRCQYCARELPARMLTVDHVKPRSKGGEHRWDNVVAACPPCNRRKGDRLPYEAHMYPRITPKAPGFVAARWAGLLTDAAQREHVALYYGLDPADIG